MTPLAAVSRRAVLAALAATALPGCGVTDPGVTQIAIATDSDQAPYHRLGVALGALWQQQLGLRSTLLGGQGSVDNMRQLRSGLAQLAICAIDVAADALSVEPAPSTQAVTALARLHDDAVHVVVPADSPATGLGDLRGQRVSLGAPRSGVLVLAPRLLAAAGLDAGQDLRPSTLGLADSITAFDTGALDAFFWSGGIPTNSITELAERRPIRLLNLAAQGAALRTAYPVYGTTIIPSGAYRGLAAVSTVSVRNVLLVLAQFPTPAAQKLTRVMMQHRAELARAEPIARAIAPITAINTQPVPLHPGAESAYREIKGV